MNNIKVCHKREELYQDYGAVVAGGEGQLLVQCDLNRYHARRAVSCLIEPEIGDLVLFCMAEDDGAYILAILEREGGSVTTVSVDGDLNLRLDAGRLGIEACEGVAISTPRRLSMMSSDLHIRAAAADLTCRQMFITGAILQATLGRIKLFADSFDSLCERLHQRVKRSYRFVEETDQVRAENIDHRAEKLLNLRGENMVINARELVKVDGEQIHFG